MARKYVRDNRGRFASVGATARGGRLKTAGGGKRQTQTMRASARPGGTVGRPKGYKPPVAKQQAPAKARRSGKPKGKVDEAKVVRIAERIRALGPRNEGRGTAARIRSLNRSEARTRAIEFLRGKRGVQAVTPAQVARTINRRKKTSTGSGDGGVLRGRYDNMGQSKLRQQRAERLKSGFDNASIERRRQRAWEADKRKRGGLSNNKTSRASEIYGEQLQGRMARGRGAEMPFGIQNRANAEKRANQLKRARPGAPIGGMGSRIKTGSTGAVIRSSRSNGRGLRVAKRAAERLKLRPMQRSEAAYQKKKFGVHSTVKNPGRASLKLPKRTTASGSRVAVRGNKAATTSAYRARASRVLNVTRSGSIGMGRFRRNPRIRSVDTGMRQLTLTGGADVIKRFRPVSRRR